MKMHFMEMNSPSAELIYLQAPLRDDAANEDNSNGFEDEWEEVAKNNRSAVTRRADITR